MESFFSRYRNVLVLLVVLVAQLLALAIQAKRPARDASDPEAVSLIRYVVVTVITPPEKALHGIGQWFGHIWFGYFDLVHVRRENTALKDQLERLRLEQASVVEDARQGQRLQQLLGFKEHYIYQTLAAQVIGTSGTDESAIIYIDKGSNDGLRTDMPVMTGDGIVGRLKDVFPTTSQLQLISDATSAVGVILESTRTRGIMKGSTYGQVQVINVSPDDRIKPGQKFITSGGDQIFPRGMPVGTVESVQPDPDRDPMMDIVVRPSANLSRLEEVLVVTGMGDTASTQEAKDLADSEAEGEAAQKRASDILSERLPSRVDTTAPADTNPDDNVDSTGNLVKPLVPPKPLHEDGFTPGATPPASSLTPGERIVPVKNGTEELPAARTQPVKKPESPASAPAVRTGTASGTAATRAAGSASSAGGLKTESRTHVVVDGPDTHRATPGSGSTAGFAPKAASIPGSAIAKPVTPVRRSPGLVPDDGSHPPAEKPRPHAAQPPAPQGRAA
jgi:rod shape-determining protein MreC